MLHKTTQRRIEVALLYVVLTVMFAVSTTPLFWSISTSLKIAGKGVREPVQIIPNPVTLDNYRELFGKEILGFARALRNSAVITVPHTIGVLFVASLAGFSFAKLKFRCGTRSFSCF